MNNDVRISGAGTISSGEYNDVKISGSGKILGDITAESLRVSGVGKTTGKVRAQNINVAGVFSCDKDINVIELNISGMCSVGGNLSAETANISGAIRVDNEANVDKFYLNSNESKINTLYGDSIEVRSQKRWFVKNKRNKIGVIEATKIDISYVESTRVSGDSVIIGPECIIETVEYKDKITVDKSSKIDTITKIS